MTRPWQTQLSFDFSSDLHPGEWRAEEPRVFMFDRGTDYAFTLADRYAGNVFQRPDGSIRAWASLGYIVYSRTASSTLSDYLGEFDTLAAAEAALEHAARVARADPKYYWMPDCSPEAIRKSKAMGYWRANAEDADATDTAIDNH